MKCVGCRSPNARVLAFRAPVFGPSCVMAGCVLAGVVYEMEGDRGGLYETRGAADTRNMHAIHETVGVESLAVGGIGDAMCSG
jgi:hypothetical protein